MKAAHEASQHLSFGIARAIEALASDSAGDGKRNGRSIFKRQQRKQPLHRRGRQTR
jgi:hypothetical protein